jgi:rhodanese-related sulfurtransferase
MDKNPQNTFSMKRTFLGAIYMGVFICVISLGFNSIQKNRISLDYTKMPETKEQNDNPAQRKNYDCEPYPIFTDQTKEMYDAQSAIFIDARIESEYNQGHIAGALNIPFDKKIYKLRDLKENLPIDCVYVIYCGGGSCVVADEVALYFCQNGYQDGKIFVYQDGYEAWVEAGFPSEP